MKIDIDWFILCNSFSMHPIAKEAANYKSKYFAVLEYFSLKYSKGIETTKVMLANYRSEFLSSDINTIDEIADKAYVKKVIENKYDFKELRISQYGYCLLCDVFVLNAFCNKALARKLVDGIKSILNEIYHQKIERLYTLLYEDIGNSEEFGLAKYQITCWQKNKTFLSMPKKHVLITANMSAGKSTLVNALVGKVLNKTMNDACTAKIHYIYDQAFEDNYTHEWDYEFNLNAKKKELMEDDERNTSDSIIVATHFNLIAQKTSRLCIIDSPGVNSATNKEHGELTKKHLILSDYDTLVYVVNAENVGTDDDYKYLSFIGDNVAKRKIIFVLNKVDNFRKEEDSIAKSVENLKKDLVKLGFENPVIYPTSSYAGMLAKKLLSGRALNEDETDEYALLSKKFSKPEFDLTKFYDLPLISHTVIKYVKGMDILIKSGLFGLEQILLQRS
ncbi:MAG: dynamin family protein [Eubacteriaceae bacterium]